MFQPLELIQEYEKLNPGEAQLSSIREAIRQADLAKDYSYMLYFRCEYANACRSDDTSNLLLYIYLIFPEILKIFEEHPDIKMPDCHYSGTIDTVQDIFSVMISCADFFYQIPISDMEKYLEKYKNFCQQYGYSLFDYYISSARLYRQTNDKERAMQCLKDFKTLCRTTHCRDAFSLDFIGEMACWYDDLDTLLKVTKMLERKNHKQDQLVYEYGRLLYCYAVRRQDFEQAAPYYNLLKKLCKKFKMHSPYFADTMVYLTATDQNAAWNFFLKEAPFQAITTIPLDKMEFSIGAEIMMRSLKKSGKETVRFSLPGAHPWQREDECYQTETLAEYFRQQAREISFKFDARNGNNHCIQEYELFLAAANTVSANT
ncbi:hypothetical protein C806_03068 [Lachnospiraceae bacterium 3-1]|nr:hypothetical protein C806_03068 [Lachnospiraceae bacterium 3-1]